MAVTNWTVTVIDGKQYLVIEVAQFRVPLDWDPSSNMFIAVAAPDGGLGNFPALVRGENGETPELDSVIDFTPLAWNDPTPDFASWTETSENVYRLSLGLHTGAPGDAGPINLADAEDLAGALAAGKLIAVNATADGFELVSPKVGDMYWPATINNTPSGNTAYTLCAVPIPAQPFDWRPEPQGWCVITGTGPNVQADLIARLDTAASGNIVGRGRGHVGQNTEGFATNLAAGPPPGSAADYNKVPAGQEAVIYLRAERQSGSDTFTTTASATHFSVRVQPIP
ncbi:minor tail protein [Mycobacterium phage TelAviv]|nr:minor tail protein [Mycobacterium phage TelAviv]